MRVYIHISQAYDACVQDVPEIYAYIGGAALLVTVLEKKLLKTEIFSFEGRFDPVLTTFGRHSLNRASKFDFGEHLEFLPGRPKFLTNVSNFLSARFSNKRMFRNFGSWDAKNAECFEFCLKKFEMSRVKCASDAKNDECFEFLHTLPDQSA